MVCVPGNVGEDVVEEGRDCGTAAECLDRHLVLVVAFLACWR